MSRKVIPIRNYLMTNCSRKYLAYRSKTQYVDAAMLRKTIISAALATGFSSVCAPSAMADGGALNIRLAVAPIIQLYVTDNVLEMAADDITAEILDSTGLGRSEGRAEFFVAANTGYNIYLSPEETWGPFGAAKVKFVGQSNSSNYIAGQLFLDTDMSSDARTGGDTDIVGWDPTAGLNAFSTFFWRNFPDRRWLGFARFLWVISGGTVIGPNDGIGNVSYTQPTSGLHRYGVGAIFDPQDWSGSQRDDLDGAPEGAESIAPPDVYSTTVTVTVSTV